MIQTGIITIEYDGVKAEVHGYTIIYLTITTVNPEGKTIETRDTSTTIRAKADSDEYKDLYRSNLISLGKRLQNMWQSSTGNIYNIQFSGL